MSVNATDMTYPKSAPAEYKVKNTEIEETIKLFNKLRSSFSREELKKLREKFRKEEEED